MRLSLLRFSNWRWEMVFFYWLVIISCSCSPGYNGRGYTEDPESSVVKLRNDLIEFSEGKLDQVVGQTEANESYILIYGYPERRLDSLPLSERLRKRFESVSSRVYETELYVLARCSEDDIVEYTQWERRGPGHHPLLSPVPIVIRGNPFKVRAEMREGYRVVMRVE